MNDLCDCSCADPCPLGKAGTGYRCRLDELAVFFGCRPEDAAARLREWRESKVPVPYPYPDEGR